MTLAVGTRLGPYEILAPIGAGGMGEVYRARDTRLQRDVAVKIVPAAMAEEVERLVRFEREARVVASLNHPNIAASPGRPVPLFREPSLRMNNAPFFYGGAAGYAVSPDGTRFLVNQMLHELRPDPITIVVNALPGR